LIDTGTLDAPANRAFVAFAACAGKPHRLTATPHVGARFLLPACHAVAEPAP